MDLIHLRLEARLHNILTMAGITTIEKLKATSDYELLTLPGISDADLWKIRWDQTTYERKHSSLLVSGQESGAVTRDIGTGRQDEERYAGQMLEGGNVKWMPLTYLNRLFHKIATYLTGMANWMMRFVSAQFKGAAGYGSDTGPTDRDEFPESPATDSVPSGSTDSDEFFKWPSTDAPAGKRGFRGTDFTYKDGLLTYVGYRVGRARGKKISIRWRILDCVFHNTLPNVDSIEYMAGWGKPKTSIRLKKMAVSIAAFARNNKLNAQSTNRDFSKAIRDYEDDLGHLHRKYYVGKFGFKWPKTDIEG